MWVCNQNVANTQGNKPQDWESIETINNKLNIEELKALELYNAGYKILHEILKNIK